MMKKIYVVIFLIIFFGICMMGCERGEKNKRTSTAILHGYGSDTVRDTKMREIYKEFELKNPDISINLISVPGFELVESRTRDLLAVGKMPNIIYTGGYRHDLREEIAFGREKRHYRLDNYLHRNAENYPTHELGPIARVLDTTLPRFYSRGFTVQGTKGMYTEDNQSIFLDREHREADHFKWEKQWGNVKDYRDRYEHPVWKKYLSEGAKKGHDGMDYLVFSDYVDCVRNKTQAGIDVYDMVSWMCITALSEQSISLGGQPVAIPDFTNGKWMTKRD